MDRHLIFDLDGTLVDTAPDLVGTLNWILRNEGMKTVPLATARDFIGHGARAMLRQGFAARKSDLSDERLDQLFEEFLVHYAANIANESRPFPGVLDALDRFEADGWRFAVCTNKLEHLAVQLLEELKLTDRFTVVTGGDTYERAKPDPMPILGTMEKLAAKTDRTIMVGDARPDIDGARNAGIPSIAVDFGYTTEPVATLKPARIISHFDALWETANDLLK